MRAFLLPVLILSAAPAFADPPPVRRATVATRAETMFDKADTNHDGFLSKAEYRRAILAIAARYDARPSAAGLANADAQFDAIDRAHAGRIPRRDFVDAAVAHFDGADLNHDGTVTPEEARKAARIKQRVFEATPK